MMNDLVSEVLIQNRDKKSELLYSEIKKQFSELKFTFHIEKLAQEFE